MRELTVEDLELLRRRGSQADANVTLIHIYDQTTAPGATVRFKSIMSMIESRLDRSPIFRNRLQEVPLGLGLPYWVEDEDFDIEYHVRHIALPKPGDWRQFCIQASRIHARALDLGRPLWEIYVVEGLDTFVDLPAGSFALLIKTHHLAQSQDPGTDISALLHDLHATPAVPMPAQPWFPSPRPRTLALWRRAAFNAVGSPLNAVRALTAPWWRGFPSTWAIAREMWRPSAPMALTRFNSVVSPHRVFNTRRFPLEDLRQIQALVPRATIHDVVLALCADSLRRYLLAKSELPGHSVTAAVPVLTLADGPGDERPFQYERAVVSWDRWALGTQQPDPVERLRAITRQTAQSKVLARAVKAKALQHGDAPHATATLTLACRILAEEASHRGRHIPLANCNVVNVPGSAVPLYLVGSRMTYFSAIMPISDGMGLSIAVTSYCGQVVLSQTSCRYLMPDSEFFSQCVRDSFQAYLALAAKATPRRDPGKPLATPRSARTPGSAPGRSAGRVRSARTDATAPQAGRAGRRPPTARPG